MRAYPSDRSDRSDANGRTMALPFNHNPKEMFTKRQFATLVTAIARLEELIQGFHGPAQTASGAPASEADRPS